eukprot:COSAG02_NODE_9883_length_2084_cov_1.462469_1_plen_69_part_10
MIQKRLEKRLYQSIVWGARKRGGHSYPPSHCGMAQHSALRGVKTTPISVVMRKKKQRFEVVRGVHCSFL